MPVCVVGMHRSGTSMVTYVLSQLGLDLGPSERIGVFEGSSENRKGFWEDLEMQGINNEVLRRYGGTWDDPPAFPDGWADDAKLDDLYERARGLEKGVTDTSRWVWKDPRSSLCLPFWRRLYPDLRLVFCVRNPLEVAKSLAARDPSFEIERGIDLWYRYNHAILVDAYKLPAILTLYDAYFPTPRGEVESLAGWLGLPPIKRDTHQHLQTWVSGHLKRQHASLAGLARAARPEILILYTSLRKLWKEQRPEQRMTAESGRRSRSLGTRSRAAPRTPDWSSILTDLTPPSTGRT